MTKDIDVDEYKCSGYGIGFDREGTFSVGNGFGRKFIIFGVDMSSSVHLDNRQKRCFSSWWISYTRIRWRNINCRKRYSTNFTEINKKFCLSFHYNRANSYLFINGTEIHKFKADFEVVATLLCLGNIPKNFSVGNVKKTGLNGYVYNFRVNYDAIAVHKLDIHKYLMKKKTIWYKMFGFIKKGFYSNGIFNI